MHNISRIFDNPTEDAAVVADLQAGDQAALHALYQRTLSRVYGLALKITGQTALAEEVTEDTYWQVWQEIDRFDAAKAPLLGWMLMICRSRAIDALRKQNGQTMQTVDLSQIADYWPDEAATPVQALALQQQQVWVREALRSLTPVQQQVLYHAFYMGLSQQEIAQSMQLPLGTIKSHIRRAQTTLKSLLDVEAGNYDK